jgi:N-acetyl-1-D-myo-inositol-2-amino-2-deoxy-alpha-D-glucopyranoside deacetylase
LTASPAPSGGASSGGASSGGASSGGGVLLVHAHPDDEVFGTGGLIAQAVAEGRRVDLVVCTGGEEGEIHDPELDPEEERHRLGEIRAAELACSLEALRGSGPGELHLHKLGYRDSGMMGTEPNANPDCFWQADLGEATGRLVSVIRAARPAVMVTYDANGNYGHPDHIQAHRVAVAAMQAAADPSRHPEAGASHWVDKFYETAFNRDAWFALLGEMKERGIKLPWDFDADPPSPDPDADADPAAGEGPPSFGTPESAITTFLDISAFAAQKRAAMECHRTQLQDFGWMLGLPEDLAARAASTEYLVLTRWPGRGVREGLREASLFEGLE